MTTALRAVAAILLAAALVTLLRDAGQLAMVLVIGAGFCTLAVGWLERRER